ncbi:MAG: ABC transporter ATP-binding protein [Deferrisomatales bacterium]|nr:ABC transporter ATP-binding protein [Deferrisomatales bacterium]
MSRGGWAHDGGGQPLDWRLLRRLWPFVRPHGVAFALGIGVMGLASVAKLAGPYLLKLAIDGPIARGNPRGVIPYAVLFLAAQLLEGVLEAAQAMLVRIRGEDVLRSLRSALFAKAQRLPAAYLDATPSGRILSRITADVAVLSDLFSSGVAALVGDILLLVGILAAMAHLDPYLALLAYGSLPVLLVSSEVFRRRLRSVYRATREKTARLTGRLQELLRGVNVLRIFAAERWADAELGKANAEHRDAFLRSVTLYALFFPLVELVSALTVALLLWQGGGAVVREAVTFGVLVAFLEYLQKFFRPVRDLSEKYNVLQASMAAAERITDFLDLPEEPAGGKARIPLAGSLELDRVGFAYDGGPPVLREVSFSLAPGEVVALVGPTGSGKSTLVSLLLGFRRPCSGTVRMDGRELGELDPGALREQMALVPQEVFLFQGSVLDNITLGRPGIGRDAAEAAARAVGLHDAVASLPQGYDTQVLEEGALLSAGQRQLVAFARALAGNPRLLILDEATSEIDQATEAAIESALVTLLRGRTSLVVAHRLATVRRADRVVVLARGQVAEQGTHRELLSRPGLYRTLYELQFRRTESGEPVGNSP